MELTGTKTAMTSQRIAVLAVADDAAGQLMAREVSRIARIEAMMPVLCTRNAEKIHELCMQFQPAAILMDEPDLAGSVLIETVRRLVVLAPVVLIAPVERQRAVAILVISEGVDFVARTGDFAPLGVGLMERRLKALRRPVGNLSGPELRGDLGEIFRHEINNPLTGILGNAEMLLSHRERLPLADAQRLQTVVDLAVRLRETTRRISNAWERQRESARAS